MAEYIDREVAKKMLDEYRISRTMSMYGDMDLLTEWREGVKCSMKKLDEVPTSDVVPKSEVVEMQKEQLGRLKEIKSEVERVTVEYEAMRGAANSYKMHYEKAKSEVAREIFAEIDKALNLSKCYGESGIYFEYDIEADIAELKKKYTEGEK